MPPATSEAALEGVCFEAAYSAAKRLPAEAIELTTPLALFLIKLLSFCSLSQFVSNMNCRMRSYIAGTFLSRHAVVTTNDSCDLPRSTLNDVFLEGIPEWFAEIETLPRRPSVFRLISSSNSLAVL